MLKQLITFECLPDDQKEQGGAGGSHPELVYTYSNKQLPTNLEALKRLFYKKKTDLKGKPLQHAVQQDVQDIMEIWYLAKLPYIVMKNAVKKLEDLFNRWRLLQKSQKRMTDKEVQNRKEFTDQLDLLFDIACPSWGLSLTR